MKGNILNKKIDTNADYKMLIENIYIGIRHSAKYWADNYSQYVKNGSFSSQKIGMDVPATRSNVLFAMDPFKEFIDITLCIYNLDYKLEKHFKKLQENINRFEKSLNDTPEKMGDLVDLRANFEENEIIKELGCEYFTISTFEDLRLHVENTKGGEDFIVREYFIKAVRDLEKYKMYLAKEFCEGNKSSAQMICRRNFEENENNLKLPVHFDKKKQEIKKEIGLVQISLEAFKSLQDSFENVRSEAKDFKVHLLLEKSLPAIERQWKAKVSEHKKKSAKALVYRGFLIKSVVVVIDELAAAEIKYEALAFKLRLSRRRDENQEKIKKAQIDFKNAEYNMKHSQKISLGYLSDLADSDSENTKCQDVKNRIERNEGTITKNGEYDDVVAEFLKHADEISIQRMGTVGFFVECFEDFRKKFEEAKSSEEAMFENYLKIKCRLFSIKRLFSDKEHLMFEETIKALNSALDKAETVNTFRDQKETLENLKEVFELMEEIIKNGETKFNNSFISANPLKSDTTSPTLSESRIPAVTVFKDVSSQGSPVLKPVLTSPLVSQGLPVTPSATNSFGFPFPVTPSATNSFGFPFPVTPSATNSFRFPMSSPTSIPAFPPFPPASVPTVEPFISPFFGTIPAVTASKAVSSQGSPVLEPVSASPPVFQGFSMPSPAPSFKPAGAHLSNTIPVMTSFVFNSSVPTSTPASAANSGGLPKSLSDNKLGAPHTTSAQAFPYIPKGSLEPSPTSTQAFPYFPPASGPTVERVTGPFAGTIPVTTTTLSDRANIVNEQGVDQNSAPKVFSGTDPSTTVFDNKGVNQHRNSKNTTEDGDETQPKRDEAKRNFLPRSSDKAKTSNDPGKQPAPSVVTSAPESAAAQKRSVPILENNEINLNQEPPKANPNSSENIPQNKPKSKQVMPPASAENKTEKKSWLGRIFDWMKLHIPFLAKISNFLSERFASKPAHKASSVSTTQTSKAENVNIGKTPDSTPHKADSKELNKNGVERNT